MLKTLKYVVLGILFSLFAATTVSADQCSMVGSFTQGSKESSFSWAVNVTQNGNAFSLSGDISDEYGDSTIKGSCASNNICTFVKSYYSGKSSGYSFYYSGRAYDDGIKGKWGYRQGDVSGGTFQAQVIDCQ